MKKNAKKKAAAAKVVPITPELPTLAPMERTLQDARELRRRSEALLVECEEEMRNIRRNLARELVVRKELNRYRHREKMREVWRLNKARQRAQERSA